MDETPPTTPDARRRRAPSKLVPASKPSPLKASSETSVAPTKLHKRPLEKPKPSGEPGPRVSHIPSKKPKLEHETDFKKPRSEPAVAIDSLNLDALLGISEGYDGPKDFLPDHVDLKPAVEVPDATSSMPTPAATPVRRGRAPEAVLEPRGVDSELGTKHEPRGLAGQPHYLPASAGVLKKIETMSNVRVAYSHEPVIANEAPRLPRGQLLALPGPQLTLEQKSNWLKNFEGLVEREKLLLATQRTDDSAERIRNLAVAFGNCSADYFHGLGSLVSGLVAVDQSHADRLLVDRLLSSFLAMLVRGTPLFYDRLRAFAGRFLPDAIALPLSSVITDHLWCNASCRVVDHRLTSLDWTEKALRAAAGAGVDDQGKTSLAQLAEFWYGAFPWGDELRTLLLSRILDARELLRKGRADELVQSLSRLLGPNLPYFPPEHSGSRIQLASIFIHHLAGPVNKANLRKAMLAGATWSRDPRTHCSSIEGEEPEAMKDEDAIPMELLADLLLTWVRVLDSVDAAGMLAELVLGCKDDVGTRLFWELYRTDEESATILLQHCARLELDLEQLADFAARLIFAADEAGESFVFNNLISKVNSIPAVLSHVSALEPATPQGEASTYRFVSRAINSGLVDFLSFCADWISAAKESGKVPRLPRCTRPCEAESTRMSTTRLGVALRRLGLMRGSHKGIDFARLLGEKAKTPGSISWHEWGHLFGALVEDEPVKFLAELAGVLPALAAGQVIAGFFCRLRTDTEPFVVVWKDEVQVAVEAAAKASKGDWHRFGILCREGILAKAQAPQHFQHSQRVVDTPPEATAGALYDFARAVWKQRRRFPGGTDKPLSSETFLECLPAEARIVCEAVNVEMIERSLRR